MNAGKFVQYIYYYIYKQKICCRSSSIIILLLEYVLFIGPARAHVVLYAVGGLICCLILNCCKYFTPQEDNHLICRKPSTGNQVALH